MKPLNELIAELRALAEKATPGPWNFQRRDGHTSGDSDNLGWDWAGPNIPDEPMRGLFSKEADAKLVQTLTDPDTLRRLLDAAEASVWRPIESAPRDGTMILAIIAKNDSRHLAHLEGRMFVIHHAGKTDSGFDLGWNVFPGLGGVLDSDFTHWMPLPKEPDNGQG